MLTGDLLRDIAFTGDLEDTQNVVFEYKRAGEVTPVMGVAHVIPEIPEPVTLFMLALGGHVLLGNRNLADGTPIQ